MTAGNRAERLLAVLSELRSELEAAAVRPGDVWLRGLGEVLGSQSGNELVPQLRKEMARLALASGADREDARGPALTALDGAEYLIRRTLAAGLPETLDAHLPAFIFMVTLPGLGRQRALRLSRQAAKLVGHPASGD